MILVVLSPTGGAQLQLGSDNIGDNFRDASLYIHKIDYFIYFKLGAKNWSGWKGVGVLNLTKTKENRYKIAILSIF